VNVLAYVGVVVTARVDAFDAQIANHLLHLL
jgi:hypothetical protein